MILLLICRGGHIPNTGIIIKAMKIMSVAGATGVV
jgi:threonyl-tRNA synthetase